VFRQPERREQPAFGLTTEAAGQGQPQPAPQPGVCCRTRQGFWTTSPGETGRETSITNP
jgi:hypothetical protein